ncbi:hypothetical protein BN946_scf184724.g5 [Trametes cinnabarina]|uniref:IMD domain-containing protein n=1 Tax=Pycnoporus cinnabarinus TaxID=5643 RepID=A0A060SV59_PYCCI|nr:hypothetical protein BN946_scf184724.g5 [Trametes cinnabarina]
MASSATPLSERAEIHKSCKTLESVVNILNEYCEAANAIVQLQKKLAKALRETASSKCVAQIPANALNASAAIFEAMSEVDTKFAKYADKECDAVSAEVKKWFRKLAKEERNHDEKIASANLKIKQAGQLYERKAKKNPRDAAEEHTRYINLLSTLGPEVNREKYNHALLVTERHSATMYSLAASFSRVADAEWARGCESVRRFSPTIGPLGQWRALCEGGWSGNLPLDLPEIERVKDQEGPSTEPARDSERMDARDEPLRADRSAPQYSSRDPSEQGSSRAVTPGQSPHPPPQYFPPTPVAEHPSTDGRLLHESAKEPPEKLPAPPQDERKNHSATLASLEAFPVPPTHLPLPQVGGSKFGNSPGSSPTHEARPELSQDSLRTPVLTLFPRLTESPVPEDTSALPAPNNGRSPSTPRTELPTASSSAESPSAEAPSAKRVESPPNLSTDLARNSILPDVSAPHSTSPSGSNQSQIESAKRPPSPPTVSASAHPFAANVPPHARGDNVGDAEFGVRRSADVAKPRAVEPSLSKIVERTDTGKSNGSVVAALRDRYSRGGEPSSPPPRELPRIPTSVSSLAHKYEPTAGGMHVSRQGTGSPVQERSRVSMDSYPRMPEPTTTRTDPSSNRAAQHYTSVLPAPTSEEIALRRQRIEELEELELREREHELRMKEREIEQRALELERERQRLLTARSGRNDGDRSDSSRGVDGARRVSITQRPALDPVPGARYPSSNSQSTSNLVPPSFSSNGVDSRQPSSQPSSPGVQPSDHAPYCGCESCSASKYRSRDAGQRRDSRPPEPPLNLRPEKPRGGWIRRLSMPVVSNAFSLDSKKMASNVGIAGGPGYRNSVAFAQEDGRLYTDLTGGIRNLSSTNLARR